MTVQEIEAIVRLLDQLEPTDLRHIAAAKEATSPEAVARAQLSDEGKEMLADILLRGGKPAIGLFRNYRRTKAV